MKHVYRINFNDGCFYFGCTKQKINVRLTRHKYAMNNGSSYPVHLKMKNTEYEIEHLATLKKDDANELELHLINESKDSNKCLNSVGRISHSQPKSEEHKRKISEAHKNIEQNEAQKAGLARAWENARGKPARNKGVPMSEAQKNKLRVSKPKFECSKCGNFIGGKGNLVQHQRRCYAMA